MQVLHLNGVYVWIRVGEEIYVYFILNWYFIESRVSIALCLSLAHTQTHQTDIYTDANAVSY